MKPKVVINEENNIPISFQYTYNDEEYYDLLMKQRNNIYYGETKYWNFVYNNENKKMNITHKISKNTFTLNKNIVHKKTNKYFITDSD